MIRSKTGLRRQQTSRSGDALSIITRVAFVLSLATVAARGILLETLRDPFPVTPGTAAYARGPGAATSLLLDLVCCIPVLLILLRRILDPDYRLRFSASFFLLLPLCLWMILSFFWSEDRFATMVSSADFAAAAAVLWSSSQLVRTWSRLRIVAAVAFGLLTVNLVWCYYYLDVEHADTVAQYLKNKDQIIKDRGWEPGSFVARQFEQKLLSDQPFGFTASPNSLAAMLVLLMTVGLGVAVQRLADDRAAGWALAIALPAPFAIWLLVLTQAKAAVISPILVVLLFVMIWAFRASLARWATRWYWAGVACVASAMAATVVYGLHRRGLPTLSLLYRWRYWTASMRMFLRHPLVGIGWDNYYLYYLRDRLMAASEEIRDPHNFIVRFFVELGVVGGALVLAWMLRLWWELSRPNASEIPEDSDSQPVAIQPGFSITPTRTAPRWLAIVAVLAIAINFAASVDVVFSGVDAGQKDSFIIMEALKRLMYLGSMLIAMFVVALRSLERPLIDDRPAPWVLYGILVGVGVFLIHNLIEFSFFEPGLTCLVALLAGSALGIRQVDPIAPRRPAATAIALVAAAAVWIMVFTGVYLPTAQAEGLAHDGDDALRAGQCAQAADLYRQAFQLLPINADYARRAGEALQLTTVGPAGAPPSVYAQIIQDCNAAIKADPAEVHSYLLRAAVESATSDADGMIRDYTTALAWNPNDVSIRRRFAVDLERLHLPLRAADELGQALAIDDQLDPGEPKRLTSDEIQSIHGQISRDQSAGTVPSSAR